MKSDSFTIRHTFPAIPERVFAAMTSPAEIKLWSGQAGTVEAKIGGHAEFFDGWVKGTVLAYETGKRVAFTWLPGEWPAGSKASIVMCSLAKARGGARLTLEHTGFPSEEEARSHKEGWKEHFFDPLTTYLAQQSKTE
jgi:uncharacterized protein YndB with AHSA1/START domain